MNDHCRYVQTDRQFDALLDRVAAGEEVLITRDGRPVARLVKVQERDQTAIDDAVAKLLEVRKGFVGHADWKTLRDKGRTWSMMGVQAIP